MSANGAILDSWKQRGPAPGGFSLVGDRLFAGEDLATVLRRSGSDAVSKVAVTILGRPGRLSRLQARRAIVAGSRFANPVVLKEAALIKVSERGGVCRAECTVGFTGDPNLFRTSIKELSNSRTLRARVYESELVVAVQCRPEDMPMIAPAMRSEIDAIQAQITAQHRVIEIYDRKAVENVRKLIDTYWSFLLESRPLAAVRHRENIKGKRAELEAGARYFARILQKPFEIPDAPSD